MLNNRVYDCFRCANRNLCKENNAVRNQCKESIKSQIELVKMERKRVDNAFKNRIRYYKRKLKTL